ncbi:MAG: hypothetical protein D6680_19890 [Cyanobacteria bacterium J007]|nr:MAG: hypothetical protein D6680_19890 [Cyanobacteria bacterium J007]
MARQLKSWESPRRKGRNSKGKGGSARARQLKKQQQMLRKQLKSDVKQPDKKKRTSVLFFFYGILAGISTPSHVRGRREKGAVVGTTPSLRLKYRDRSDSIWVRRFR